MEKKRDVSQGERCLNGQHLRNRQKDSITIQDLLDLAAGQCEEAALGEKTHFASFVFSTENNSEPDDKPWLLVCSFV